MKKNDYQTLAQKPKAELATMLQAHRDKLWQLKADLVSGKVKNVREIVLIKKSIARILTALA